MFDGPKLASRNEGSNFDADKKRIEAFAQWFNRPDVHSAAEMEAKHVCAWQMANRSSTNPLGDEESKKPWWPIHEVDWTDDPIRIDLRLSALRKKAWGHGMRRFLNRLIDVGVINEPTEDIRGQTTFTHMALYEELVGYTLSKSPNRSIGLNDLTDRFELSEGNNPANLRPRVIVPQVAFGLLKVRIGTDKRYDIRLGPLAAIFHSTVFSPVRIHFAAQLSGGVSK